MSILKFKWGTVESTPDGALLDLTSGNGFQLGIQHDSLDLMAEAAEGNLHRYSYTLSPKTVRFERVVDNTSSRTELRIEEFDDQLMAFAPITILAHNEAKDLADALRKCRKP